MDRKILLFLIIHSVIYKAWSAQLQPIKQYLVSGPPPQSSNYNNLQTIQGTASKPSASLGSVSNLASFLSSGVPTSQHVSAIPSMSLVTDPSLGLLSASKSSTSLESLSTLASLLSSGVPISHLTSAIPAMSLVKDNMGTGSKSGMSLESLSAIASLLSTGVPTSQHAPAFPTAQLSMLGSLPEVKHTKKEENSVDTELLNNLAIALQLMIVNNILSAPTPETPSKEPAVVPSYPIYNNLEPITPVSNNPIKNSNAQPSTISKEKKPNLSQSYNTQYTYEQQPVPVSSTSMPNANFVGSSGFGNSNPLMGSVPPASLGSSRTGFTLMSPYEALSPSSPYSDPILSSPYGSVISSKRDFQSPYTAIMAADNNKDLFSFSMNDLF